MVARATHARCDRVYAIAEHLRTEGKYSDGVRKSEQIYHPGHNVQRLSDGFVNAQQMVGNDEQYAAAMALLASEIGVPARVVLGAVVPEGGVVTGKDVLGLGRARGPPTGRGGPCRPTPSCPTSRRPTSCRRPTPR